MKKTIVPILCLAFFSLACLQTAAIAPERVSTVITSSTPELVHVAEPTLTKAATAASVRAAQCAQVTAMEALHMRASGSENAAVVAYLRNGDVVHVVPAGQRDDDWWFIEHEGLYGYARSIYLVEMECE